MEAENYTHIVLGGGSSKAILTLGALQYGYDNNLFRNVSTYIGTSAGSLIGYLLAIGYTPIEIMVYLCISQVMEKIQHFNIVAMIDGGGATSFYPIQDILEKMTVEKIGRYVTLGDVKKQFGKTLICVTHNLTKDCVEYLHPETHPDLPCLTALRMSANLPLVFEKFKYMGNFYIDGGISDNFAIQLADKPENIVELVRTKKRAELKDAVNKVISCDEDKECKKWVEIRDELTHQLSELDRRYEEAKLSERKVFGCLVQPESANFNEPDDSILEYIYRLMFIPIHQAINYKIRNCSQERCTIFKLSFAGLKFFNFNIAPSTKLNMFSKGYSIVKSRFEEN